MPPAKILAVDDEPDFETLITQRFRREIRTQEFQFRFARHGEEALAALAAEPDIDLMLLDINMPVMDGLTLLSRLREQRTEVRTIMVSAYGDMANLRTAMNRGAFDFVTKPVDFGDLELTVRKTIDDIERLRDIDRQALAVDVAQPLDVVDRLAPGEFEVAEIHRLGHEVEGAAVHRGAQIRHVAIGRHHDRAHFGPLLAQPASPRRGHSSGYAGA